jgi:hypothetical protein
MLCSHIVITTFLGPKYNANISKNGQRKARFLMKLKEEQTPEMLIGSKSL